VPVAIVGTFAVMAAAGFSLNNLTLFGLVLAIGIVVDDAIVVVEAVQRHIEAGLAPREATIKAMSQVSGPVIAVGLVLSAVFVPCAFISGITGQFYRQFALTIATSTLISAFNSLTLSPALAALLLRHREEEAAASEVLPRWIYPVMGFWIGYEFLATWATEALASLMPAEVQAAAGSAGLAESAGSARLAGLSDWLPWVLGAIAATVFFWASRPLDRFLDATFRGFNRAFNAFTTLYGQTVGRLLRASAAVLVVYGGLLVLTWWGFTQAPAGFIPMQDKGYLLVNVQLPDAASVERTQKVMATIQRIAGGDKDDPKHYPRTPGVKNTVAIAGQSLLLGANAPNFGAMYVMLDDFHKRAHGGLSGDAIAAQLQEKIQAEIPEALVSIFGAPPVDGLGTAGGFKLVIEDRGGSGGLDALQDVGRRVVDAGNAAPSLQNLFTSFRSKTPWIALDIDRPQAKSMGV
jgi:multidrug efflux pump